MRLVGSLVSAASAAARALTGTAALAPAARADSVAGVDAPPSRYVSHKLCGNVCSDTDGYDDKRRVDTVVGEATGAT